MQEIEQLNSDPFNLEYQKKIEEAIRLENVNENMENVLHLGIYLTIFRH
jgi:DNA damage-inducible protein 1